MGKKHKLTKKQKETLKRMKTTRQIDSNNLRDIINNKLKWVNEEILKGQKQIVNIKTQINRLEGIKLFITDLQQPSK